MGYEFVFWFLIDTKCDDLELPEGMQSLIKTVLKQFSIVCNGRLMSLAMCNRIAESTL